MSAPRDAARRIAGRSYVVSRRVAIMRMSRGGSPPIVVFSMGKTGSTALANAIATATGRRVFQVFRLTPADLEAAERRYRATQHDRQRSAANVPFPGALHLWESQYLLSHPGRAGASWTVVTPVREPVAQAVSAFFHARGQRGSFEGVDVASLTDDFVAGEWIRPPLRWFEREFAPALGIDVYAHAFDTESGYDVIETPAVRVLLVRQENLASAVDPLGRFVGLDGPITLRVRNEAATKTYAATYAAFARAARLPASVLDRAYGSTYARHFYTPAEIRRYREIWSGAREADGDE